MVAQTQKSRSQGIIPAYTDILYVAAKSFVRQQSNIHHIFWIGQKHWVDKEAHRVILNFVLLLCCAYIL